MWTEMHTRLGRTCAALAAGLIAAALPVVVAYARAEETAVTKSNVVAIRPTPADSHPASAAEHSASMVVVGSLLIGIGSVVRRAA